MLIPIGHEGGEQRRLPWITYALAAICVFAFLDLQVGSEAHAGMAEARYREAIEYLVVHPWLEAPEELGFSRSSREFLGQLRAQRPSHELPEIVEKEQQQLDQLVGQWQEHLGELPFLKWGYRAETDRPITLITSQFIHADWMHLFGNLLFLMILGPPLEDVLGRLFFPLLYLLGGAFAAFFHGALTVNPDIPLGGASGAVAALMGLFLVRFAGTKLRFLLILFPFYFGRVGIRAWVFLAGWALLELFKASIYEVDGSLTSGVAHLAHFGGFGFGLVIMFLFGVASIESRWIRPGIDQAIADGAPTLDGATPLDDGHPDNGPGPASIYQGNLGPREPSSQGHSFDEIQASTLELQPETALRQLEIAARLRPNSVPAWTAVWDQAVEHGTQQDQSRIAQSLVAAAQSELATSVTLSHLDLLTELFDRCGIEVLAAGKRIELAEAILGGPKANGSTSLSDLPYGATPLAGKLLDSALEDRSQLTPKEGLRLVQWLNRSSPERAARLASAFLALTPADPGVKASLEQIARG